ncbi:MAG: amidohydrolase family protein [Eubacteriales bacterium]|nr:amidohydrolase family protein [Eubacteriales bacterium]
MFKFPIIDSHIHMYTEEDLAAIENAAEKGRYRAYTLLSSSFMPQTAPGNLSVMWAKMKHAGQVYGYASLHAELHGKPNAEDLLAQVKLYHKMGFDGIKMIDGKPSIRKDRVPLDDPCYDPMFTYLEENQIPVLYHSNDPIEFWNIDLIPDWAREAFLYGKDVPSKDQITRETVGILKKHPGLNITIAHLFFLPNTGEYELACELMEKYPNFFMDFTPGWEMFGDMHRCPEKWRNYVIKYSERLTYGTDINGVGTNVERLSPLQKLFETEEELTVGEYRCYGLKLDDATLKNIYLDTYRYRIQKKEPLPMNMEDLNSYVDALEKRISVYKDIDRSRALSDMRKFKNLIMEAAEG